MRTFIITTFILLLSLQGMGQIKRIDKFDGPLLFGIKETNEDFFNESEYILEVKIISAKEYWRGKPITSEYSPFHLSEDEEDEFNLDYHNEMILVSYLYKVLYVYKGNEVKKADTIEFFIPKKLSEYNACGYAYLMNFNPPYKGVIFGKKSNDKGKAPYFTISPLVNLDYAALYYSDSQEEHNFRLYGLRDLYFKTKADFYKYASQFDGITVPKIKRRSPHEDYYAHKARFTDFMNKQYALMEKAKANKKRMGIKTNRDLTLSIQNQHISNSNGKKYFEFDMYAQANSNDTYYSNAISRITFNTGIFGVNLASNGKITLTKGEAFDDETYTTNAYDFSPTIVNISLNESNNLSSWNRTKLTTIPQILFHVKIEILSNAEDGYANILFTDTDFTPIVSLYSLSADGDAESTILYDNTYYINPSAFFLEINPKINNFSPENVIAGVGDEITIYGKKFGTEKGIVIFPNANKGEGEYTSQLDNSYINYWSDTQIKVTIPSKDFNNNGLAESAGTGFLRLLQLLAILQPAKKS